MRNLLVITLGLAASAFVARADETLPFLKVGGETYSNVTVVSVSASDICFVSNRGIGNAKLRSLEPAMQAHFHYDAPKADELEQQQSVANLEYVRQMQAEAAKRDAAAARARAADEAAARRAADPKSPMQAMGKLTTATHSFLNQPAPDFVVEKWLTPEPDRAGKFVLIDFWATWCGPCRRAITELNAFNQKFPDKLVIIGVSDESESDVRKMADPKIDYSMAIDPAKRMYQTVGVKGIPDMLLIDPHGIVRWEGNPSENGLSEKLLTYVFATYGS